MLIILSNIGDKSILLIYALCYIRRMIELALPAGKLENGIIAYKRGADAIYFGLKDFSARKGAGNFSLEDLSKISHLAKELGKKYYITINTLIDDSELNKAYEMLKSIVPYKPDGIIVQDLGIINMIKRDFPSLHLHGSTQLAIHSVNGVKELKRLGFERVVLSRELTLKEIENIRKACPDIELKVFIHGALCYGFSGLCMASHIITGRSANEGECAQICRTYFKDRETDENIYPFSLSDMRAGRLVKELERIGIDSLKVEGRLKGNEYVAAVTDYYRAIIDGKDEKNLIHPLLCSFSRKATTGYLESVGPNHNKITTGSYTAHLGEFIGKVIASDKTRIEIKSDYRIKDRDGLMILSNNKPYKFSAKVLKEDVNYILLKNTESKIIPNGEVIYRISDSSLNIKVPSLDIPLSKTNVDIKIEIKDNEIIVNDKHYEADIENAKSEGFEEAIRRIFSQSGDSEFEPHVIDVRNSSSFKVPYIKNSDLKKIRRTYLENLAPSVDTRKYGINITNKESEILPDRSLLSNGDIPWNLDGVTIDCYEFYTLPPVTYNEDELYKELYEKIKAKSNVRIGLNNVSHLAFAREHKEFEYFADIYLYLSNREAAKLLVDNIESFIGGYLWLERSSYEKPWPFTPTIVKDFTPPLFISRACYRHDGRGLDCKGCKRHYSFKLSQNANNYIAYVDNCQTVVVKEK